MPRVGVAHATALHRRSVDERAGRCAPGDPLPGGRHPRRRGRRGRRRRHRGRDRRGPPGLRRRRLAAAPRPASVATCCCASPTCSSGTPRRSPALESLDTGKRLVESRVRRRRHRRGLPPLRSRRRRGGGPGRRHRQPRRGQPDRARAGRRLRPGHAVELPAAPGLVEGRALPGRRQHLRPQAERADPAHGDPPDDAARGGRPARRGRQPGARRGRRGRCPAGRGPAGRPGLLHRRPRDRPAADGRRRGHGQEGRPRARRQEPQRRLRRRRPRRRPRLRADRGLPALRPGLLGRRPAGRRGVDPRRVRRPAGRARRS